MAAFSSPLILSVDAVVAPPPHRCAKVEGVRVGVVFDMCDVSIYHVERMVQVLRVYGAASEHVGIYGEIC